MPLVKKPTTKMERNMQSGRETQAISTGLVMFYFLSCKVEYKYLLKYYYFCCLKYLILLFKKFLQE